MATLDLDHVSSVLRAAVAAGGAAALRWFDTGVVVETKPDRTPVTRADRESEAAILDVIRAAFPDHAILAEETGAHAGRADARWIVDPLDGTRGFTRGGPFWGPLVAFEFAGEVIAGGMALPVLGEAYWAARGRGAWIARGGADPAPLRVSTTREWGDAVLSMGELHCLLAPPHGDAVVRLATSAAQARCYGDLASCAQVLTGRADAWIEAGVKPWDLGPLAVLVEEAGGRFTDWTGAATVHSGNAIATNGLLHEHVLAAVGRAPR